LCFVEAVVVFVEQAEAAGRFEAEAVGRVEIVGRVAMSEDVVEEPGFQLADAAHAGYHLVEL